MAECRLGFQEPLELRITQFKNDPEKMRQVNEFLNDLFHEAEKEAARRNGRSKGKLDVLGFPNAMYNFYHY